MPNSGPPIASATFFRWIGTCLLVLSTLVLIATPADSAQDEPRGKRANASAGASPAEGRKESKPSSPLHDFLGIDTETGQFKPQQSRRPAPPPALDGDETGQEEAGQEQGQTRSPTNAAPPRPAPTIDDLPRTAEEANEAFRRASERINDGSLDELSSVLGESMRSHPVFRLHRQIIWLSVALMLVYPLGIVFAELLAYLGTRNRTGLTELDQRFQRTRLWRRLTLAAVLAAVIVLFGFGSANSYWWDQPTRLAIFAGSVLILAALAVVLANLIRQASRTYELDLIREVRREQLEMRADLDELRQQMKHTASS